jgi:hypothetical protein
MAMSRLRPVFSNWPGLKTRRVAPTRTPVPTSSPVGVLMPGATSVPGSSSFAYNRSWNSTWLRLKPVVLTLARLLAITSTNVSWAIMPVADVENARIMHPSF